MVEAAEVLRRYIEQAVNKGDLDLVAGTAQRMTVTAEATAAHNVRRTAARAFAAGAGLDENQPISGGVEAMPAPSPRYDTKEHHVNTVPTTVPTTALGNGLTVSAQGFGAMALADVYGSAEAGESLATLRHAVDVGVTFIDTADLYGAGSNEELIATLLADRRDEVTIATKFGITGDPATGMGTRGDAAYVRQAIDASLTRLGTDVIDLYYMHRRDLSVEIEETVGAMAEMKAAGKVLHLGLSEVTADEIARACAVHPIAAVQSEWSIWSRDVERHVIPAARAHGVGFVPYSPLGRGFLTGTITSPGAVADDWRGGHARFADDALQVNLSVAEAVRAVAAEVQATPAQVALAWLYAKGRSLGLPVVPIPGTRRGVRVTENAAAVNVDLPADTVALLDSVADHVVGTRSDVAADLNWVSATRE